MLDRKVESLVRTLERHAIIGIFYGKKFNGSCICLHRNDIKNNQVFIIKVMGIGEKM